LLRSSQKRALALELSYDLSIGWVT